MKPNLISGMTAYGEIIKAGSPFAIGCLRVLTLLLGLSTGAYATAQENVTPEDARAIAKEAYIFNYPLVMYYRTMYLQAIDEKSKSYSGGSGNWLPAPEGPFWPILRTYGPEKPILDKSWKLPPVKRVN